MFTVIRLILSLLLIYLAYGETGPWTTLALILIMSGNEMVAFILKHKKTNGISYENNRGDAHPGR